jgi:HAD superfamily hydrolase (TIGR01484 family)
MKCPRAAVFDVDDTLAESFQPPPSVIIEKLRALLERIPVAIISAAGFVRIERDFLCHLTDSKHVNNLFVLPNSSAEAYTWADGWNEEYSLAISQEERALIEEALRNSDLTPDSRALVIDRGVQVAYAAVGLHATLEEKKAWDPTQVKRRAMKEALDKFLPGYEVLIGGMTTIDITKKGVNKAYGVRWLAERLKLEPADMLYVGDALYEGGNDAVVIPTGIQTRAVSGPSETETVLDELLKVCA